MSSVKMVLSNKSEREALEEWEAFLLSISNATTVDVNETPEEKSKRIKRLEKEGNQEEWFAYYFPQYCTSLPAKFQKESTIRVLKAKRIYQRRAWGRGLSKSTRRMFEIFYKVFVQKLRANMLMISKNEGNAIRLLAPYRGNLECNHRLINDYGKQKGSKWAEEEFITRGKCSFRAVGMGQNPRGAKMDELRVNILDFDDADDDEVCENPDRLEKAWKWVEKSAIPTVDISLDYYIFFDNNLIAEDSLAVRAAEFANDVEDVPLEDNEGNSMWPEKNSDEHIKAIKDSMSYESYEGEYRNNPLSNGKTFPEVKYGKCPPLKDLEFVVVYADPSPSNNDIPKAKSKANNSCKAVVITGELNDIFYVYKAWVNHAKTSDFISWMFLSRDYCEKSKQTFIYIENNSLQNPFYEQVYLPQIAAVGKVHPKGPLMITPDDTEKPGKWIRIEGTLEPLNRLGQLVFNIDEMEDPHMKKLVKQFTTAKATSKVLDGPDATQGGIKIIQNKKAVIGVGGIQFIRRPVNNKRY